MTLTFEKRTGLSDQLKLYGGDAANGPTCTSGHMTASAHLWRWTFSNRSLTSLTRSVLADDLPLTVEAGQIDGTQYLLPVYFETLLFLYNKDLWQGDIPADDR